MEAIPDMNFSDLLLHLGTKLNADRKKSEKVLCDMLHVLRDNLPYDKAILVYKGLPEHLKKIYTSGWNNSEVHKPAEKFCDFRDQFLKGESLVVQEEQKAGNEVKRFLIVILELLRELMPGNQLKKVIQCLPEDMRDSMQK
ncbi:MAG TPA: DUF2267 domain-containing protein, partial [Cytophagaceae bacterium]|nr:DUF2267 domain-containing protein [Cytophagaceae bacterium]